MVKSRYSDEVWLEPNRYCWVPTATRATSSNASPQEDGATNVAAASYGIPTCTGAIRGTVPKAEIVGPALCLLRTRLSGHKVHIVDASNIGA